MPKRKAPLNSTEEVNRDTEVHNSGSETHIQSHDQSDHGTSASDSNTTQNGQQVKLEILPSTLQKSSTKDHNQSNSHFHNHGHAQIDASNVIESKNPPKMIMLPDSLRVSGVQKRRRVVRACDRCRKLKIKCSGDLPCIHCTVYNYECTYDQPNKSKRKNSSIPEARPAMNKFSKGASNLNLSLNFTQGNNAPHPNVIFKSVNTLARDKSDNASFQNSSSANKAHGNEVKNGTSMERFNSSTVSVLASSNPELFSKLTDRLKLYDDILHRLLPEIKLTDLNDNPKPINPMKLMTALNKMRDMGKSTSKSSSKHIAQMYDTLPDIPLPALPISKLPPNHFNRAAANVNTAIPPSGMNIENPIMSNNSNLPRVNSNDCTDPNNSPHQGIDGSLESSMGKEIKIILPPREVALDLITKTWENACVLFRFYHRVAFVEDLNELYDTDPNHYTNKQQRFLPLVYSVMACGALFYKSDENTNNNLDYNNNNDKSESEDGESPDIKPPSHNDFIQRKDFEDEGYKYFIAARKLIDITDTRDTYGIQTIVMLIIFLQCSARLSTCYAYIGIALRAALREGLHRKLDYPFNPIELEIRKRLFWTIYKMDIYANTMLGLPRTISSDDFDQDMPEELDDENITVNGYRYDRQGDRLSSSGIANAHTRLIFLMKEVVAKLYPIKPKKLVTTNNPNNHYRTISNASNHTGRNVSQSVNISTDANVGKQTIADEGTKSNVNVNVNGDATNVNNNDILRNNFVYDLELKLQDWMNSLPLELKPGVEPPGQYLKANRLLHISYLHVKIILYRPFIHYISANVKSNSMNDLTCIEKAKTCINVARIVVKLAEDMINKNMLSGSYWFSIYTIFFSVACLVYYVHFAPSVTHDGKPDPEYMAIKKDAENGKRVLDILKDSSMAARRTYNILNALFEQLNRKTARAGSKSNLSGSNRDTQFVPAHMASSEYENERTKQAGQTDQHDHNKTPTEEPQKFQTSVQQHDSQLQQFPYNPQYQAQPNQSSPQMSNIYNASGQPNYPAQLNMSATYSDGIPTFDNSTMNAYTDQFDTRGSVETGAVNTNNNANPPGQFNANDYYMTESHKKSLGSLNDITEYKYVPGFMDQMDMKIFGRFLPPYMLGNKNGGEGGQNADSINSSVNVDVTRTDNPNHVKNATTTTSTAKDVNANVNGADVFQPSMGLFNYVKNNGSPGESEVFKAEDEENAVEATEHVYQPNTVKSEGNGNGSGNGNPYIDSTNCLDSDLLESTNYFFNQVTKSNAIPSGLSTVFQSENDKNNATSTVEVRDVRDHNIDTSKSASEAPQTIEVPSRFTSHEGVGMLDELLFGSAWDDANANKKASAAAGENVEVDNEKNKCDT